MVRRARFAEILDGLLGRAGAERRPNAAAERLLAAGRRALAQKAPGPSAMARAIRIFRGEMRPRPSARSLLSLVLDTLLAPAPALRTAATAGRFLRFEGEVTLELQVTAGSRGVDLRGQVTPHDFATEVRVVARRARRASIAADGTFLLRGVPRGTVDLEIGSTRVQGLEL